jgi:hypothetical protein
MKNNEQNEFLINTMVALLKQLKAHQLFVEWIKNKAGKSAPDLQKVLDDCHSEVANDSEIESKFRGIVEDALQAGHKNLDLALDSFLKEWTPKGKPN